MSTRDPVLTVRDLRIRYANAEAVAGVSFQVGDGEVVALLGPTGPARRRRCGPSPDCSATRAMLGEPITFTADNVDDYNF